ncbi:MULTISPECIES: hypothetical protein [unclassified Streptomyces]|uniref:hypothetical protein n=1 Tax=unclassified Streptomyces TaxID=2593676 RepID=UPI003813473E
MVRARRSADEYAPADRAGPVPALTEQPNLARRHFLGLGRQERVGAEEFCEIAVTRLRGAALRNCDVLALWGGSGPFT